MRDELFFNKVVGAILATALAIFGLGQLTSIIFPYQPPAKQGYFLAGAPEGGEAAAPVELPIDWGTELPKADVAAGKQVASKCQSCHTFDQGGANMTGPNQWGIVGRPPASHPGFAYSDAMKAFGQKHPVWDYELINEFVTAPQKYIDGTKMTFIGLKQRQDRINVIAYLHTLGSSLPIPAPKPAAPAPAAAKEGTASATEAGGASSAPAASSAAASSAAAAAK